MRHTLATLLTLFPGLGLGYALLGRWMDFALAFVASVVAWTLLYLGFFVVDRPVGVIFQPLPALPVMLLNLSLAHRIWTQTPAPSAEEGLADEHWYTFHAASFLAKGFFALTIAVLGVTAYSLITAETSPERAERFARQRMEDDIGDHRLSNRTRLVATGAIDARYQSLRQSDDDLPPELVYFRYQVSPGDYTLDFYPFLRLSQEESLELALMLKQPGLNLVYNLGRNTFVLHTTDDAILQSFIDDVCTRRTIPDTCGGAL